jgi:hypothetical protein
MLRENGIGVAGTVCEFFTLKTLSSSRHRQTIDSQKGLGICLAKTEQNPAVVAFNFPYATLGADNILFRIVDTTNHVGSIYVYYGLGVAVSIPIIPKQPK